MTIHVDQLRPGSVWEKSISRKRYTVVDLAIDSTTSGAVVIYRKADGGLCTRPLGEFMGDVLVPASDPKEYVPRFVPVE